MQPIDRLAHAAADGALRSADLSGLRVHAVVAAGAAVLVLLVATALSVYKPPGMTRYGVPRCP